MGLESNPNFPEDLEPSWPVGSTDSRREGDDHLRNLKRVIQTTLADGDGNPLQQSVTDFIFAPVGGLFFSYATSPSGSYINPQARYGGTWVYVGEVDAASVSWGGNAAGLSIDTSQGIGIWIRQA